MKKLITRILALAMTLLLVSAGTLVYLGYREYVRVTDEKSLDAAAEEIRSKEHFTRLDDLPSLYLDAVVAVEDKRFYDHNGVDIIGIGRAIWVNIRNWELREGGSTITQQLIKNIYFETDRGPIQKIAETFGALEMEKRYSKRDILELYVNNIYFGDGYYCIYDAAMGYYGIEPGEMGEYESTMLAGVPNSPSAYSPSKNPELAEQRRQVVLRRLNSQHKD